MATYDKDTQKFVLEQESKFYEEFAFFVEDSIHDITSKIEQKTNKGEWEPDDSLGLNLRLALESFSEIAQAFDNIAQLVRVLPEVKK